MEVGGSVPHSIVYSYLAGSRLGKNLIRLRQISKTFNFKLQSRIRGFDDYFHFPFDITKPMPSSSQKELIDLVNFLNSKDLKYFLADGSLLGIVRDGKLIDHDTDLDFYLVDSKSIWEIHTYLSARGFMIGRRLKHKGRLVQMTYFNNDHLLIDFLFWQGTLDGNYFWVAPEIKGRRVQNASYFDFPSYITWRNLSIRTFGEYELWLKLVYGENWRIPEKQKTDWTKTIGDLR
jgi:hypothetical protein